MKLFSAIATTTVLACVEGTATDSPTARSRRLVSTTLRGAAAKDKQAQVLAAEITLNRQLQLANETCYYLTMTDDRDMLYSQIQCSIVGPCGNNNHPESAPTEQAAVTDGSEVCDYWKVWYNQTNNSKDPWQYMCCF
jgi:hypothetical protein